MNSRTSYFIQHQTLTLSSLQLFSYVGDQKTDPSMDTVIRDVKWLNHNESFIKTAAYNTLLRREQKTLLILHGKLRNLD